VGEVHRFQHSLTLGHWGEQWVAENPALVFGPGFRWKAAAQGGDRDRAGTDGHVFTITSVGAAFSGVQIKVDGKVSKWGNVFVEFASNRERQTAGGIEASNADRFIYLLPEFGLIVHYERLLLLGYLKQWMQRYPFGNAANAVGQAAAYHTGGAKVPVSVFLREADHFTPSPELQEAFGLWLDVQAA
jgi:hypothetical protein